MKARWCVRGYVDPDLLQLDTSAPTLSMEGFSIAMQLIASQKWRLNIADVEGAFLRGDALDPARGRIYIDLPPGGVPGVPEGSVVEAVKTIYGFADAPKAWWQCFSAKLKSLGMRVSKFDPCLFYTTMMLKTRLQGPLRYMSMTCVLEGTTSFRSVC